MKIFKALLFLVGLGLLGVFVRKVGLATIGEQLFALQWRFAVVTLFMLPKNIFHALGWQALLRARRQRVPFRHLYRFKLMEPAINLLSMANMLGGDVVRAVLLREHLPPMEASLAIVLDRVSVMVSGAVLTLIGCVLCLQALTLPALVVRKLLVGALLAAAALVALFLLRHQLYRVFNERWTERLRRFDREIVATVATNRRALAVACGWNFIGKLFGPLELWAILLFLGWHGSPLFAVMVASASNVISTAFSYVPGEIGVMEGGMVFFFALFGTAAPLAITFQLVRRLNTLVWLGIGSALLLFGKKEKIG